MKKTYNWWTNYETRLVSLRCNSKEDVAYISSRIDETIENNRDVFSSIDGLLWDLLSTNINWEELEDSFDE